MTMTNAESSTLIFFMVKLLSMWQDWIIFTGSEEKFREASQGISPNSDSLQTRKLPLTVGIAWTCSAARSSADALLCSGA
ncbi:MAG: hypothetical protein H0U18_03485 [Pyrinomonadaceae bacterium]|nr:hypothetical protein [Pyrinomonadaceae bacterium]